MRGDDPLSNAAPVNQTGGYVVVSNADYPGAVAWRISQSGSITFESFQGNRVTVRLDDVAFAPHLLPTGTGTFTLNGTVTLTGMRLDQ